MAEGNRVSSPNAVHRSRKGRDLIPDPRSTGGHVLNKVEDPAIMLNGSAWVSMDNDGIDGHSGETMLFLKGGI